MAVIQAKGGSTKYYGGFGDQATQSENSLWPKMSVLLEQKIHH